MQRFPEPILNCLKPPGGDDNHGVIEASEESLRCPETGTVYPFVAGVPSFIKCNEGGSNNITNRVRSFYEENPFPNYDGMEEFGELVSKGRKSVFASRLLDSIGYNNLILECGCGTGQMCQFLQLNNNYTLGVDLSLNSLKLAIDYKTHNKLPRSSFAQMDLFELGIKDNSFDVVIAHGVLHHTFDARLAFSKIVKKLRPGGIIIVGLYNRYARIMTKARAQIIGAFGPKIDYVARHTGNRRKAEIWISDQYYNPHETWHSIDEVRSWFVENNVEFLNCYPPILGTDEESSDDLFAETNYGTLFQRAATQVSWIFTTAREGALFDVIGRREKGGN